MKKFDVEITETLQRKVSVEAAWIPAISPVWISRPWENMN